VRSEAGEIAPYEETDHEIGLCFYNPAQPEIVLSGHFAANIEINDVTGETSEHGVLHHRSGVRRSPGAGRHKGRTDGIQ
jgi:hypothetical protein